jgi:DNA-binding transcriptional LysR family regulator
VRARVRAERQREREERKHSDHDQDDHEASMPAAVPLGQINVTMLSIMEPDRLSGVELRHFLALQAVGEHRSFGRAAKALGYTQSAISQQIAALERAVGEKLVERPGGPRAVSLTEAGQLLLRHAEAIVARMKAAQADLAAFAEGEAGPLRIGTYQSVSARLLPVLVRRFKEQFPKVDVQLSESAIDDELEARLERGEVDLSFVMLPMNEAPLEAVQLLVDPYVLIVPADSPLAGRPKPPSLREIGRQPLIGYRHCRSMAAIETAIRRAGAEPRIVFRTDDNGTVQGLVGAGVGVALVPRLTLQPTDGSLQVIDMRDLLPPRLIGIAWHRDRYRTPAARAFVELAQELCAANSAELVAA